MHVYILNLLNFKRLLKYIEKQCLKRTFVSISEGVGLNEKTIRNIFRDCINRLQETIRFKTFRILLILICPLYIIGGRTLGACNSEQTKSG